MDATWRAEQRRRLCDPRDPRSGFALSIDQRVTPIEGERLLLATLEGCLDSARALGAAAPRDPSWLPKLQGALRAADGPEMEALVVAIEALQPGQGRSLWPLLRGQRSRVRRFRALAEQLVSQPSMRWVSELARSRARAPLSWAGATLEAEPEDARAAGMLADALADPDARFRHEALRQLRGARGLALLEGALGDPALARHAVARLIAWPASDAALRPAFARALALEDEVALCAAVRALSRRPALAAMLASALTPLVEPRRGRRLRRWALRALGACGAVPEGAERDPCATIRKAARAARRLRAAG